MSKLESFEEHVKKIQEKTRFENALKIINRSVNYLRALLKDYLVEQTIDPYGNPITVTIKVWWKKPERERESGEEKEKVEEIK